MASASREWLFGVQTNTARKIHRSDHTEGRLTTAPSGCCVRKLHRRLGQRELQFLDFGPLPALDEVPAAGALTARHPVFHRGLARIDKAVAPPIDRLRRDAVAGAASAIVISPDITASTICSRVSTGTGSLDLLKIVCSCHGLVLKPCQLS
jgi:hypothetical protein